MKYDSKFLIGKKDYTMLTKIRNSLIAQGDIKSSDFKNIERACNPFSHESPTLDIAFRHFTI
jgi:hypothetical protein